MRYFVNRQNIGKAGTVVTLPLVLAWVLNLPAVASAEEKDVVTSERQESSPASESPPQQTNEPRGETWIELSVYPSTIDLTTGADYQRFVCVATRADGVTLDVTREASVNLSDPALARLENNVLYPTADGETKLIVSFAGMDREIPVCVTKAGEERPIEFKRDVMPVFMRAGCNTGSCHGSSRGQDGFRLSLFGFDPRGDHFRLTRELSARRLNLALPEESLILKKATGSVPHTGGKRFEAASPLYETIRRWIAAGVPRDPDTTPTVADVQIYPPAAVLEGEGASQQFIAVAKYSDGTDRDVTDLAVFLSNNDNSAAISADGLVEAANRGEAFVMARFDTITTGSQVLVLPKDLPYVPPTEAPANYIDELVGAKLQKLRLEPSEICSDEVFLRRVTLDITGTLPTTDEYRQFLADTDPAKRAKRIDKLLERKEFSEIWAMKWAELLMVKTVPNRVEYKPMFLYSNWLTGQIADNVPLDEIVRKLLAATGGTFATPATNFYQIEPSTQKIAENVAQVFLGIRMQCAQCHNHPFDRWTMDDYYSFTAFFAQIGRKRGEDYRETIVFNSGRGEVKHPVSGRVMAPKFLGGDAPKVAGKDRRKVLADWITAPENPYFAPNIANRVWAHFFGVGIVEPVDDFRVSNPPSNPQLLEALGKKLVETNYDLKQLVRDICNSNAYQRSTTRNASNAADEANFAHGKVRRIRAECLLDCLSQMTETKDKFPGLPLGARAVQIADGKTSTYFLSTFGRAKRDTVCACEPSTEPTLSQSLNLLNGAAVENKIRQGKLVERLLERGSSPQEVIEELTLRCFGRRPTQAEIEQLTELISPEAQGESVQLVAPLQDVFWALLNSREFLFNR